MLGGLYLRFIAQLKLFCTEIKFANVIIRGCCSRLPYSTDSYFHDFAFVFASLTNVKVTNMKNTAGKSATVVASYNSLSWRKSFPLPQKCHKREGAVVEANQLGREDGNWPTH